MSMAHGLEIRCPLLDHRLVELAFRIPTADEAGRWTAQVVVEGSGLNAACRPTWFSGRKAGLPLLSGPAGWS